MVPEPAVCEFSTSTRRAPAERPISPPIAPSRVASMTNSRRIAPTGAILREFVVEATLLGAIGGVIGLSAGALLVVVLNAQTAGSGTTVFLLTPALLLRSFLFATILGALAGIYPALRAARLDPVQALRST